MFLSPVNAKQVFNTIALRIYMIYPGRNIAIPGANKKHAMQIHAIINAHTKKLLEI